MPYAGVVWLEERNLDALVGEVAFRLSEVNGCVIWRGVPKNTSVQATPSGQVKPQTS